MSVSRLTFKMELLNSLTVKCLILSILIVMMSEAYSEGNPVKRMDNPVHMAALQRNRLLRMLYDTTRSRVRRGHRHMSDAGYGSRISAASKMMNALIARHDVYGAFGPGKRKRGSEIPDDRS